jgi:hypothetical protein
VQARAGEAQPAHPAQAEAALGSTEHLLDPGPFAPYHGVVHFQLRERLRPAPSARVDDAWRAAPGTDDGFGQGPREGTVVIYVARLGRQHRLQFGRVVDVGGRDLDGADQPSMLVCCDMDLIAVHRLATAMTCPARLAVMADARRRDQRCMPCPDGSFTGDGA